MSAPDSTFDRRIFDAYQHVKEARANGKYAAIVSWLTRVDALLDERLKDADATADATADGDPGVVEAAVGTNVNLSR